ncbi:MAG TPA: replicative DNA helicase [Steroidobacteraceae bacterium]|nr:replicative DNA helicase [Steroidobacteraceae bacterium]
MSARVINRTLGAGDGLRLPPHSIEAEQSVLGGLMLDAAAWDQIADRVIAEDFYRNDHRLIFEAVAVLIERSQPCDAVTLSGHLESQGLLDQVGGLSYLGSLARDTPTTANIRAYADIVRERSVLRQLITAGNQIVGSALEPEGREAREVVDEAERAVFEIAERGSRGKVGFRTVKSILPDVVNRIDELYHSDGSMTGISTGFKKLDEMTSGLQPGDLIIIAGRPSMGKTTLAVNIAENAALGSNKACAIFSMEMSAESLTLRMISSLGRINQTALRSGKLQEQDWPRIDSAMTQLGNAKIFVDETPGLTPTEIRARARRLKRERGLDLIVVDYLQLMQVAGTKENRATEISEISRSLKALAKELKVPVIALSQLNRGVEQRVEKKPVMSDLRECVTGETLVCLADGRRVPIRELVGQTPEVWAMSEDQKIIKAQSDRVWSKGVREIYCVALASGRWLRATPSHRVFTGDGWKTVGELAAGSRVAIGRQFPKVANPVVWSDAEICLLGHLVGDGSYLKGKPLRYTTASEANSKLVTDSAIALGSTVKRYAGRGQWHQLLISGNGNRWHAAGVGAWLKKLGIHGQRSHQKHLPREVFQLSDAQIGLLLRHLWATDGCIHVRPAGQRGSPRVYYSTCSRQLAHDVAALLLRLGIVARTNQVRQKIGWPVYTVGVSGSEQQALFLERVGAFGPREAPAKALVAKVAATRANPNVDTLPRELFTEVRAVMSAQGVTDRQMASMRGVSYGASAHSKFAPSRAALSSHADFLRSDRLQTWANSHLFWDRVVAVGLEGAAEVFDMTVPGPASWLADGIVSHNSGAIEQDSDLILLIYREEVYDANTTRKGIADIIIAKQRNGPTGDVQLTFLGQYTKFENYAPESYAEGVFR